MLSERSKQVRRDTMALSKANGGYHYGGSFSCAEILISLFDHVMGPDDQFILSKGHAAFIYYVLLREKGFNPRLMGHPERDPHNGIWCSTGSLGHGLPMAVGMAWAKKMKEEPGRVFILMGDGECQAGTTWESMLIASRLKLDNLAVIVDWNGIQGSDFCEEILPLTNINLKTAAESFGWDVVLMDGHNVEWLSSVTIKEPRLCPFMAIAGTIKGKGVSFMENDPKWHSKWLNEAQEAKALEELS